ncbi:Sugar transport protein 8 [Acorus calamus]|uniref:Sugar transport protein 8 n=1 Tax=Acorus calamus TaxID=4465 RepID=A0AAV9EI30_ACOCL|nr:Sugar transport protein 8 [Acorus calamus]
MPAVVVSNPVNGDSKEFEAKITIYVVLCAIIAATGGLMFGYDIGISGGVTSMDDFLEKFFPTVYVRKHHVKENNYCKYDNQRLQLFTSSLYLAALVSSFVASKCCSRFGRRPTMQAASLFFLVGVALNAAAQDIYMLIIGRILLGIGVGFANQLFQNMIFKSKVHTIIPVRDCAGEGPGRAEHPLPTGRDHRHLRRQRRKLLHLESPPQRVAPLLGLAGVPALILCLGSLTIAETPTSLIERGKLHEGLAMLRKIRGTHDVCAEYDDLISACEAARAVTHPFRNLAKRRSRPQLVIAIAMQGTVNVVSTLASVLLVDRAGRRALLLEACAQMFASQVVIGALLSVKLGDMNALDRGVAWSVVVLVCVYVSSFAWSWGPLGWLIPSETFPLETRTAGFAFAVSANMLFTFLIAQAFLSMMCKMRAGIFFFFAGWIVVMAAFVVFLLPETKGVPIDEMVERVWKKHPYWKRFMEEEKNENGNGV